MIPNNIILTFRFESKKNEELANHFSPFSLNVCKDKESNQLLISSGENKLNSNTTWTLIGKTEIQNHKNQAQAPKMLMTR